jgi:hypothetical protein
MPRDQKLNLILPVACGWAQVHGDTELPALHGKRLHGLADLFAKVCRRLGACRRQGFGRSVVVCVSRDNLRAWLDDPQALKPQCNMPSLKLSDNELDALTDYLCTLK